MRFKVSVGFFTILFFILLLTAGIFYGNPLTIILLLLALALHETAHFLFAELFGYQVNEFKLTPLGGCLVIDSLLAVHPVAEFVIAAAGPCSNILMALGVAYLEFLGIRGFWLENWRQWNLLLGAVNLIPALPLDGGRMLHALLKKLTTVDSAAIIVKILSLLIAGLSFGIGLGKFGSGRGGFLYLITGCFIFFQVFNYQSPKLDSFWKMSEKRKQNLAKRGYAGLKPLLVKPDTLIRNVLRRCGGNEFLLFLVNESGSKRLIIEDAAWDLLISKGYGATFRDFNGLSGNLPK